MSALRYEKIWLTKNYVKTLLINLMICLGILIKRIYVTKENLQEL